MRDRILWLYPIAILITGIFVYVVVARNQPPEVPAREAGTIFNLKTTPVKDSYLYEYDVTFPDGVVSHRGGSGGKIIVDPFRD